jgi:alcohol dehydrogenase class IV
MAGLAFTTTGLGLCHAIGHSLSARLGVAHGVALTVMLPHVMAYNLPVSTDAYARTAGALEVADCARSADDNAAAAIAAVRRLGETVGLPSSLSMLGCTEELLPAIVADALADDVLANNPRQPTGEELLALLRSAL